MARDQAPIPAFGPTLLTWFVPGSGHALMGDWRTAALGFLIVEGLYLIGFLLSNGQAFEFLDWELRGRFALVLSPEIGNAGALLAHQMVVPLSVPPPLVPPTAPPTGVHIGAWLTAVSGIANIVLMAHAHLRARIGGTRRALATTMSRHLAAGLLFPGLGHWLQGRRRRAVVVAAVLLLLFAFGTYWAEGTNLSREHHFYYWSGQMLAGLPALAAELVHGHPPLDRVPSLLDAGIFYACLAGLLNGLVLIDVYAWDESRALDRDPIDDRRSMFARRRAAKQRTQANAPRETVAKKHLVAPTAASSEEVS